MLNLKSKFVCIFLLGLILCISPCLIIGCESGGGSDGDNNPVPPITYSTPCNSTALAAAQNGLQKQPASAYVNNIILRACQIGNVPIPQNGAFNVIRLNNAYYSFNDEIGYDADWLFQFVQNTGFMEAGDSIIYHEVGHLWAKKNGVGDRIGYDPQDQYKNWSQEYQADSFAGYVLKQLNGNALPSVQIYNVVMANWGLTHPPGNLRAQVFFSSWQQNKIILYARTITNTNQKIIEILSQLKKLSLIRDEIFKVGLNPYCPSSDDYFNTLLNQ